MKPLVLITYLVLVLAVVGQALHVQDEATGKPATLQVREVPNHSDRTPDTVLDRTERIVETQEDRTESALGDTISF